MGHLSIVAGMCVCGRRAHDPDSVYSHKNLSSESSIVESYGVEIWRNQRGSFRLDSIAREICSAVVSTIKKCESLIHKLTSFVIILKLGSLR